MYAAIKTVLALSLLISCTLVGGAQVGPVSDRQQELQRQRNEAALERRMNDMRSLEQRLRAVNQRPIRMPLEPEFTKHEKERIKRLRQIDPVDLDKYKTFLNQDGTGIFKLFPDLHCWSKNVVRISKDCERFVPITSSFTFRGNEYIDPNYHDIYFEEGKIFSRSFFMQGIFGIIGDEPIESVTLAHAAAKFLGELPAATNPNDALQHAKRFRSGVEVSGHRFVDTITPAENTTYVFRTIAYKLENSLKPLSNETTSEEKMFLSLAFDKRQDMIVVFRILRRDDLDGLTIVWRELDRKDAAKIKFGKNQVLRDFRTKVD